MQIQLSDLDICVVSGCRCICECEFFSDPSIGFYTNKDYVGDFEDKDACQRYCFKTFLRNSNHRCLDEISFNRLYGAWCERHDCENPT